MEGFVVQNTYSPVKQESTGRNEDSSTGPTTVIDAHDQKQHTLDDLSLNEFTKILFLHSNQLENLRKLSICQNLWKLDLAYTGIQSLESPLAPQNGWNDLYNLRILYLHGNNIRHIQEFGRLKNLRKLQILTIYSNPCVMIENTKNLSDITSNNTTQMSSQLYSFRQTLLELLPCSLLALDSILISPHELVALSSTNSHFINRNEEISPMHPHNTPKVAELLDAASSPHNSSVITITADMRVPDAQFFSSATETQHLHALTAELQIVHEKYKQLHNLDESLDLLYFGEQELASNISPTISPNGSSHQNSPVNPSESSPPPLLSHGAHSSATTIHFHVSNAISKLQQRFRLHQWERQMCISIPELVSSLNPDIPFSTVETRRARRAMKMIESFVSKYLARRRHTHACIAIQTAWRSYWARLVSLDKWLQSRACTAQYDTSDSAMSTLAEEMLSLGVQFSTDTPSAGTAQGNHQNATHKNVTIAMTNSSPPNKKHSSEPQSNHNSASDPIKPSKSSLRAGHQQSLQTSSMSTCSNALYRSVVFHERYLSLVQDAVSYAARTNHRNIPKLEIPLDSSLETKQKDQPVNSNTNAASTKTNRQSFGSEEQNSYALSTYQTASPVVFEGAQIIHHKYASNQSSPERSHNAQTTPTQKIPPASHIPDQQTHLNGTFLLLSASMIGTWPVWNFMEPFQLPKQAFPFSFNPLHSRTSHIRSDSKTSWYGSSHNKQQFFSARWFSASLVYGFADAAISPNERRIRRRDRARHEKQITELQLVSLQGISSQRPSVRMANKLRLDPNVRLFVPRPHSCMGISIMPMRQSAHSGEQTNFGRRGLQLLGNKQSGQNQETNRVPSSFVIVRSRASRTTSTTDISNKSTDNLEPLNSTTKRPPQQVQSSDHQYRPFDSVSSQSNSVDYTPTYLSNRRDSILAALRRQSISNSRSASRNMHSAVAQRGRTDSNFSSNSDTNQKLPSTSKPLVVQAETNKSVSLSLSTSLDIQAIPDVILIQRLAQLKPRQYKVQPSEIRNLNCAHIIRANESINDLYQPIMAYVASNTRMMARVLLRIAFLCQRNNIQQYETDTNLNKLFCGEEDEIPYYTQICLPTSLLESHFAATRIQAIWRGYGLRSTTSPSLAERICNNRASVCLQRWFRHRMLGRRLRMLTYVRHHVDRIHSPVVFVEHSIVVALAAAAVGIQGAGDMLYRAFLLRQLDDDVAAELPGVWGLQHLDLNNLVDDDASTFEIAAQQRGYNRWRRFRVPEHDIVWHFEQTDEIDNNNVLQDNTDTDFKSNDIPKDLTTSQPQKLQSFGTIIPQIVAPIVRPRVWDKLRVGPSNWIMSTDDTHHNLWKSEEELQIADFPFSSGILPDSNVEETSNPLGPKTSHRFRDTPSIAHERHQRKESERAKRVVNMLYGHLLERKMDTLISLVPLLSVGVSVQPLTHVNPRPRFPMPVKTEKHSRQGDTQTVIPLTSTHHHPVKESTSVWDNFPNWTSRGVRLYALKCPSVEDAKRRAAILMMQTWDHRIGTGAPLLTFEMIQRAWERHASNKQDHSFYATDQPEHFDEERYSLSSKVSTEQDSFYNDMNSPSSYSLEYSDCLPSKWTVYNASADPPSLRQDIHQYTTTDQTDDTNNSVIDTAKKFSTLKMNRDMLMHAARRTTRWKLSGPQNQISYNTSPQNDRNHTVRVTFNSVKNDSLNPRQRAFIPNDGTTSPRAKSSFNNTKRGRQFFSPSSPFKQNTQQKDQRTSEHSNALRENELRLQKRPSSAAASPRGARGLTSKQAPQASLYLPHTDNRLPVDSLARSGSQRVPHHIRRAAKWRETNQAVKQNKADNIAMNTRIQRHAYQKSVLGNSRPDASSVMNTPSGILGETIAPEAVLAATPLVTDTKTILPSVRTSNNTTPRILHVGSPSRQVEQLTNTYHLHDTPLTTSSNGYQARSAMDFVESRVKHALENQATRRWSSSRNRSYADRPLSRASVTPRLHIPSSPIQRSDQQDAFPTSYTGARNWSPRSTSTSRNGFSLLDLTSPNSPTDAFMYDQRNSAPSSTKKNTEKTSFHALGNDTRSSYSATSNVDRAIFNSERRSPSRNNTTTHKESNNTMYNKASEIKSRVIKSRMEYEQQKMDAAIQKDHLAKMHDQLLNAQHDAALQASNKRSRDAHKNATTQNFTAHLSALTRLSARDASRRQTWKHQQEVSARVQSMKSQRRNSQQNMQLRVSSSALQRQAVARDVRQSLRQSLQTREFTDAQQRWAVEKYRGTVHTS